MITVADFSGKDSHSGRRRGFAVLTFFLFAAPIFLIALIFAMNAAYLAQARRTCTPPPMPPPLPPCKPCRRFLAYAKPDRSIKPDPGGPCLQAQNYGGVNKVLGRR